MHYWGDKWFKEHDGQLNEAINILTYRVRKWAHCGFSTKEKYGSMRTDFVMLWDGGIRQILTPYKGWVIGHTWWAKFLWYIDNHLIPYKKTKYGWLWVGLANLNWAIGLTKLVHKWQAKRINKAFQVTCKEFPELIDELICDVDCYEIIKPCKWGDVDGTKIHNKYWKTIDKFEDFEL